VPIPGATDELEHAASAAMHTKDIDLTGRTAYLTPT